MGGRGIEGGKMSKHYQNLIYHLMKQNLSVNCLVT